MSSLPSLFETFLGNIRPTEQHIEDYKDGHESLRDLLRTDDGVSDFYVGDFLQGSYRRWTAVRPIGDEKSDVDIVFVTNLNKEETSPREAMEKCVPFLNQHYEGKWSRKDRAFQIDEGRVEIDLVLTASPSEAVIAALQPDGSVGGLDVGEGLFATQSNTVAEALGLALDANEEEWRDEPLDIPDRRLQEWDQTHPIATIEWTLKKNDLTDGHYVNVVKAIKWWRRTQVDYLERPKGYPLEHLVGECCPNGIDSVAEGITRTFETVGQRYATEAENTETPRMSARGLPKVDVFARLDGDDFAAFHDAAADAATLARRALETEDKSTSRDLWHKLLGDAFPEYGNDEPGDGGQKAVDLGSSSRSTSVSDERFA